MLFCFRSAKEAEDKIKKALEKGETLPTEARFDSNCITPGKIICQIFKFKCLWFCIFILVVFSYLKACFLKTRRWNQ